MPRLGFIRSKNEIKFLILYIAERLIEPVPFDVMQNLTLSSDGAIEFFDFSECLGYLVQTEHLSYSDDGLYLITEKGIMNGRAVAHEIPYSVRLQAEELVKAQNQKLKRARQVVSRIKKQLNGTYGVDMRFNDDYGIPLWRMELAVPDKAKAEALGKRFEKNAEKLYMEIVALLMREDEEKTEENE